MFVVIGLVVGLIWFIIFYAADESIFVIIDIEENKRRTAEIQARSIEALNDVSQNLVDLYNLHLEELEETPPDSTAEAPKP
jgi:hypothetical protein